MFEREPRYTVLKINDIIEALTPDEKDALIQIEETIDAWREANEKRPLKVVVVEDDWPEYEPVWEMIERRVTEDERMNKAATSDPFFDTVSTATIGENDTYFPEDHK